MKFRVKQGFVLGHGRIAQPGDVIEIERDEVRMHGIVISRGPIVHPSFIEPYTDDQPAEALQREAVPTHRDPEVRNRVPRARRRRGSTEG